MKRAQQTPAIVERSEHRSGASASQSKARRETIGPSVALVRRRPTEATLTRAHARRQRTVLTPAKIDAICSHIEKGLPMDTSARLEGVSPETLTHARKHDEELAEQIEVARARSQAALIALIHRDADAGRNINRSTWLLERLFPKQFHLPAVLAASAEEGHASETDPVTASCPYTPDELRSIAHAALACRQPELAGIPDDDGDDRAAE